MPAVGGPRIAIIIDDLGYRYPEGIRATELPGPVACAVLPGTPRGRTLAVAAHENGKEVFLHLPLQAVDLDGPDEPGDIQLDMSRAQFAEAFDRSFRSVPHIVGVNTHRGSLLTRHPGHMGWLMEEINARGNLVFVDSFTTSSSVALRLAREVGVPALRRDVFLDFDRSTESIAREFARLKAVADRHGSALGIGHPYTETLDVLEREIPRLAAEGYDLVPVSALLGEPADRQTSMGGEAGR